jgi:outer membrane protein assembly factor BamB
VADGKVVTFGVNGTLSCLTADKGEKLWRTETGPRPMFHTSSSPLVADKLVVVQVGSEGNGGVSAYGLEKGEAKWKWNEEGASYSSPVLMTVGDTKMVVAMTSKSVVGIGLSDGKTKWKVAFPLPGQRNYNAATPTVDGQTVIFSGSNRGTKAVKVEQKGDAFEAKELWSNKEGAVMYNSPVVKKGEVYGLAASDTLFCINARSGKTEWTHSVNGRRGYGTIVDAGPVLMALTPTSKLIVFEPTGKDFNEVASYSVGNGVYAYPIVTGDRIYVKDKDSVILWELK